MPIKNGCCCDLKSSLEFLRNGYLEINTPIHTVPLNLYTPLLVLTPPSFLSTHIQCSINSQPVNSNLKYRDVLGRRCFALLDQDIGNRSNELVLLMEDVLISPQMGKKA